MCSLLDVFSHAYVSVANQEEDLRIKWKQTCTMLDAARPRNETLSYQIDSRSPPDGLLEIPKRP